MTPDRFFALLLALQTREHRTVAELAGQVGVSTRTVVRDLRWLQDAGFPILIRRGRWGGVTLLPGGALDTARLTPDERDQLALAGLDHAQRDQLGARHDGRRALDKVTPRARSRPDQLLPLSAVVVTDNRPWFAAPATGAQPARLAGDLRRGVRLRIHYRRATEAEPAWQVVDPYGLLAKSGRWYLVADKQGSPGCTRWNVSPSGSRCASRAVCAPASPSNRWPPKSPRTGSAPRICASKACSPPGRPNARAASSAPASPCTRPPPTGRSRSPSPAVRWRMSASCCPSPMRRSSPGPPKPAPTCANSPPGPSRGTPGPPALRCRRAGMTQNRHVTTSQASESNRSDD